MKFFITSCVIHISILTVHAEALTDFYKASNIFLNKYVNGGKVDYKGIAKNKTEISSLYKSIGEMKLSSIDDTNKKAFYINAYNLIVIHSIVGHYPVNSPMAIDGFFDKVKHKVAGEDLTLNELEKEKLLKPYKDARFHFALVCAARSCPPLMNEAYLPDQLESQLTAVTTATINNNQWMKVNTSKKEVQLSKIFEWYTSDFNNSGKSLLEWINNYRTSKIPITFSVGYYEYDWSLNE